MAALRNLAVGALKLFGRQDIAEATRWATRKMEQWSDHSPSSDSPHDLETAVGAVPLLR